MPPTMVAPADRRPAPASVARDLGWLRPLGASWQWSWEQLCDLAVQRYWHNRVVSS